MALNVIAERYEMAMKRGKTEPHQLGCDDGYSYVVKFQGNRLSNRVLIREYVASRFLTEAGYSIAEGALVEISQEFWGRNPVLAKFRPGLQFGSRVVPRASIFDVERIKDISNSGELAQIIVAD